jgi:hypothetical protein
LKRACDFIVVVVVMVLALVGKVGIIVLLSVDAMEGMEWKRRANKSCTKEQYNVCRELQMMQVQGDCWWVRRYIHSVL